MITEVNSESFHVLSPQSIESITVLKDGSAVSLYGEKERNGVIIAITKR